MDKAIEDFLVECGKTLVLPAVAVGITHWWHTRTHSNLPGLLVNLSKWGAKITPDVPAKKPEARAPATAPAQAVPVTEVKPEQVPAILFEFKNATTEVVFIQRCRLSEVTNRFRAYNKAFFDIGERSYELKFQNAGRRDYTLKEIVLQTGETGKTTIPLEEAWDGRIPKKHRHSWLPPFRKKPELFCVSYEVTTGDKVYNIRTAF